MNDEVTVYDVIYLDVLCEGVLANKDILFRKG